MNLNCILSILLGIICVNNTISLKKNFCHTRIMHSLLLKFPEGVFRVGIELKELFSSNDGAAFGP